jgi:hypothetical protein
MTSVKDQLQTCLDAFRQGQLTEQQLQQALAAAEAAESDGKPKTQDLLYLQAGTSSLASTILGMSILKAGQLSDGSADPDSWPYLTVLDAIRDGWRVIQFPNMALMLDETRTYGLGCEFILEK